MSSESSGRGTVSIRRAGSTDAEADAGLISDLIIEISDHGGAPDRKALKRTASMLLGIGTVVRAFIAEDDRHGPVGIITLNECAAIYAGGMFGEISEFYVAPGYRSLGIGRKLMEVAVALAGQRRWTRLEVGTPDLAKWRRTFEFYQGLGFVEVGPRLKLEF